MGEDIKVDAVKLKKDVKVTASVLDAFDLLKGSDKDSKLNGGAKIISRLQGGEENEKELQYVLTRLVRSLGANVPEIRTGYFATLVALLKKFQVTVTQLLDLIKKELHANGSSKSEVGDVALGQILVCGAIFRSGHMLSCSTEEQKELLQLLLTASAKKSYLGTAAYLILIDFINGLNEDQFSSIVWLHIKQNFKKDLKEHSLDSLYFLMVVSKKFPAKVKLHKLLGVTEILCEDNIHTVCEKLMSGIDFNSLNHPIYKEVGITIAQSPHLQLFWSSGIDSQLVKHNRNRELVAVNMLTTILNNLKDNFEVIPELISKNFFKLFMDWFKGLQTASKIRSKRETEDDHKIMIKKEKELLNALNKALKSKEVVGQTRVEVLKKLLFDPGELNFTELTGTSIVKSIIADLDKEGVQKLAKKFKGVLTNSNKFVKGDFERNWFNNERIRAAELISYLVSHDAVKDHTEFKLTHMKLLMCFGFFKISTGEESTVSSDLSTCTKSCFYRCFTSRFTNVDSLVEVLSSLAEFINSILQKEQVRTKLEKQFPKENMECWELLTEVTEKIQKNEPKSKIDKVFLVLLYQLGLFLFSEPDHVKMARSSIKELKSCYEHYRKGQKKKKKTVKEGSFEEDEPEWIEVLIEVLLSILSTESSVLRSVVQCVFRLLWEYITPTSVGQILSVLDPGSENNPLTEDSDSENEDDDKSESDDDDKEDDEEKEGEDSEDSSDEENDDKVTVPEQLRMAVQKALGAAAAESDDESVDADMIDEEDGKKLDDALAEAFRQFNQGKGKKTKKDRKDKKALSDFRIRALDLIDIYLEKELSMDICLGMIAPLTRCLEFCIQDTHFSELENRVRKTIKILTKIRKFSSTDGITMDILCDNLKSIIDKGSRSHFMFQAVGDIITQFATFIIHCSLKIDSDSSVKKSPKKQKPSTSPLVTIFKEALQSYFQNRNCMLPIIFFHSVLQTEWNGNYELVPVIVENLFNNNVRHFRRNEGLELITGFYRSLKRSKPSGPVLNKLNVLEEDLQKKLTSTLQHDSGFEAKNNFFAVLKKLINTMKMFHENCHIPSSIDFKSVSDLVGTFKGTISKSKGQPQEPRQNQQGQKRNTKKKKRKLEKMNGHAEPAGKKMKKNSESE